jgi:branched-chain amino acid transport system permease protein
MKFMGLTLNAKSAGSWVGAAIVMLVGAALFEAARRRFAPLWGRIQEEIEREIKQREVAA